MSTTKTTATKTSNKGRWNEAATELATRLYQESLVTLDGETQDQAIARAASVENLKAIGASVSELDSDETYTPTAVRMKLVSEKVFQKSEIKASVGGSKSLRKAHIIRALQANMSDTQEEQELFSTFEKATLPALVMLVKKIGNDDLINGIMKDAGVDSL